MAARLKVLFFNLIMSNLNLVLISIIFLIMSIQALFIVDKKGNILISRSYKLEIQENFVDNFIMKQMELTSKTYSPFLIDEENEVAFTFLNHKNIVLVTVSD